MPEFFRPVEGPASPAVNAALRVRLEQLVTEYDRVRGSLTALRERLAQAAGEAESHDGSVRVTVDARGGLRTLEITPRAYRHWSPSELAAEILRLAGQATDNVRDQMEEVMAPFLPAGVSYADAVSGNLDPAMLAPVRPLAGEAFEEWLASLRRSGGSDAGGAAR